MEVRDILHRVEHEIRAGRTWRAKEILRGALSSRAEPELLERYGRLLDTLADRYEAGKYFFLSGVRRPEYVEPIEIFLTRHASRRDADLMQLFPAAVRRLPFEQLPLVVQDELRARKVRESRFTGQTPIVPPGPRWKARLTTAVGMSIFFLFMIALALGFGQILRWLGRFFA